MSLKSTKLSYCCLLWKHKIEVIKETILKTMYFLQEDPNDIDPKRKDVRGNDVEDKAQSVETLPPGIAVLFVMKDP